MLILKLISKSGLLTIKAGTPIILVDPGVYFTPADKQLSRPCSLTNDRHFLIRLRLHLRVASLLRGAALALLDSLPFHDLLLWTDGSVPFPFG